MENLRRFLRNELHQLNLKQEWLAREQENLDAISNTVLSFLTQIDERYGNESNTVKNEIDISKEDWDEDLRVVNIQWNCWYK